MNDLCILMQTATAPDYKILYEQSQLEMLQLKQQLEQLKKMIFGSRQERFIPSSVNDPQLSLAIEAESTARLNVTSTKQISYTRTNIAVEQKPLQHPGRMKLPESLRREEIIIEPSQDFSDCKKMGEGITEVLEYAPGEL